MEIFKIIGIAILTCFVAVIVKQVKPEFYIFVIISGCVVVSLMLFSKFSNIFSYFSSIIEKTHIGSSIFTLIIKIMGIAYLTEFAVNICIDTNNSSLADKVALAGKVIIICMALPLITSLLDVIIAILPT